MVFWSYIICRQFRSAIRALGPEFVSQESCAELRRVTESMLTVLESNEYNEQT
jgi:hypothetical protein